MTASGQDEASIGTDTARAAREAERFNQGLKRDAFRSVFAHTTYRYRPNRFAMIRERMNAYAGGAFLEIGSTNWLPWMERNGVSQVDLTCINISQRELDRGRKQAEESRLQPAFRLMDANNLEFPDGSFDVVFGGFILHHLEFERAIGEIARVLKPGGMMLFHEPLASNPVGRIVRALTPEARTVDEQPLRPREIGIVRRHFDLQMHFEQFLTVPAGVLSRALFKSPDNFLTAGAHRFDEWLISNVPAVGQLYRHVVLVGYKGRRTAAGRMRLPDDDKV